jgi:hypothetical protein
MYRNDRHLPAEGYERDRRAEAADVRRERLALRQRRAADAIRHDERER